MAPHYCIACSNNSRKKPQYSYFRFPLDEKRCDLWKEVIGIGRLKEYTPEQCYKRFFLCSTHFQTTDFAGMARSKLKRDAVPSIFDNKPIIPITKLGGVTKPDIILEISSQSVGLTPAIGLQPAMTCTGLNFLDAPSKLTTSSRQVCAVKTCSKTYDDPNVTLFRFPKDPDRCKRWVEACDQRALYDNVTMSGGTMYNSAYRVCNQHFLDKMFNCPINKIRLSPYAYPVINLEKTIASELIYVIPDIYFQPSTSSTVVNQMDTSKDLVFQDHIYAKTESGLTNFGTQTVEKIANDNLGQKDDILYVSTSLSAPSKSSETCQHLDNNQHNGGSAFNPTKNRTLDDDNDCVIVEDTPPLWHFNYLPDTQGFMKGIGDTSRRMRWFQLRSPSVT